MALNKSKEDTHIKDLNSNRAGVRWCEAPIFFLASSRYAVTTYTVEWINDADARFSVQVRGMHGGEKPFTNHPRACFNPDDESGGGGVRHLI